jgi:hypothetical protein
VVEVESFTWPRTTLPPSAASTLGGATAAGAGRPRQRSSSPDEEAAIQRTVERSI